MSPQAELPASAACHVKNCGKPSTTVCERCGVCCCDQHTRHITLERRDDPDELPGKRMSLARVPTHVETYILCTRCSTRPVELLDGKLLQYLPSSRD